MRKVSYTSGLELEQFILDNDGRVSFSAPSLLAQLRRAHPQIPYQKEVGQHMIEYGSKPSTDFALTFRSLCTAVENAVEVAGKNGLHLYPFGSYPAEFDPELHSNMWYELKRTIFGEDKYKIMGLCVGTHFHFALPGKVFDARSKFLVANSDKLSSQKMVSSYNLLVAADPVLTTLMQSSPYIQGEYLAKDSRMLFYRGGTNLGFDGLYTKFQQHGGLQGYINTIPDIIARIETRYQLWKSALLANGFDANLLRRYGRKLDYAWNPVKVNKLGTFEQRGMDANLPSYLAGSCLLIQKMLLRVYRENLKVVASERGQREPFTLDKNELHLPPSQVVLRKYQALSATEGLSNDELHAYCRALYEFVLPAVPPRERTFLSRVREMLHTRRTLSDELIDDVRAMGTGTRIGEKAGCALALRWSERLTRDLRLVSKW